MSQGTQSLISPSLWALIHDNWTCTPHCSSQHYLQLLKNDCLDDAPATYRNKNNSKQMQVFQTVTSVSSGFTENVTVFKTWSQHRSVKWSTVHTASSTKHTDTTECSFVHCVQLRDPIFCLTTHNHQQAPALIFQNVQHDLQNKHLLGTWQAKLWCTMWQVPYKGREDRPQTLYAQFLLLSRFI